MSTTPIHVIHGEIEDLPNVTDTRIIIATAGKGCKHHTFWIRKTNECTLRLIYMYVCIRHKEERGEGGLVKQHHVLNCTVFCTVQYRKLCESIDQAMYVCMYSVRGNNYHVLRWQIHTSGEREREIGLCL